MSDPVSGGISPQARPVVLKNAAGQVLSGIKVDKALARGGEAVLVGWATAACTLQLLVGEQLVESRLLRKSRPDVARALRLPETGGGFGFSMTARLPRAGSQAVVLRVMVPNSAGVQQSFDYPVQLALEGAFSVVHAVPSHDAAADVVQAFWSALTGDLMLYGWLIKGPKAVVWLETDVGQRFELEGAYRFANPAVGEEQRGRFGASSREPGLWMRCAAVQACRQVRLLRQLPDGSGTEVLAECTVSGLELDPVLAAKRLFAVDSPSSGFVHRLAMVDGPSLDRLLTFDRAAWADMPVERHGWGQSPAVPLATLVIPLFGRIDFVENQLIEFARDPWLQAHAQLVYVLDDERLVESMTQLAAHWFRLYGVPFEWVFGGVNRGYSGANNLGAAHARGEFVVFLNSDAYPLGPGWLEPLCQALKDDAGLGIVGARLIYPDGSLQHAGMEFLRREDLGVWINHHPLMGCPVELDPHTALTRVPAVTGACMAMRRATLEAVDGWDTGYLVGDFEDSDLCFKVRATGLDIAYLPTVTLIHLERQSFKLVGQGDFRQRVVLFNAARHQQRWGAQIAALALVGDGQ